MWQYYLVLDKYWGLQSGYFSLEIKVASAMRIRFRKPLLYHGISNQNSDNKIIIREYNDSTVYDWLNNPFIFYCGIPPLNLPHMPIDYCFWPKTIFRYTLDSIPSSIYVASINSVITLSTPFWPPPSSSPNLLFFWNLLYHYERQNCSFHG